MPTSATIRNPSAYFYVLDETAYEVTVHEPQAPPHVPEALVHDLWAAQRFETAALETTSGEALTILDPGTLNTDAGPDFRQARLRMNSAEWVGDVEIHTRSGDWFAHGHHRDARYNSVTLHVTLHTDVWTGSLTREDGSILPEIVLYGRLEEPLRRLLHRFYTTQREDILCGSQWNDVPENLRDSWVDDLARERMRQKMQQLPASTPVKELLHERIFAALGYAKNGEPMSELARRVPLDLTRRLDDPRDLEALHLGAAGFLPLPSDLVDTDRATADYAMNLRERYTRLQTQYFIPPMPRQQWRFFRLRPANFPTLRIAQAVALLSPGGFLRDEPVEAIRRLLMVDDTVKQLEEILTAEPPPFWNTHLHLDRTTSQRQSVLGASRRRIILTNAVAPVMLADAERRGDDLQKERVFKILRALPAPSDVILRRFRSLGAKASDALEAQGLHQLYRTRCTQARCLECAVGGYLLGAKTSHISPANDSGKDLCPHF